MKSIVRVLAVSAVVSGLSLCAQEEDVEGEPSGQEGAAEKSEADTLIDIGGQIHHTKSETKFFFTLPSVRRLEGQAEAMKPGAADWEAAVEGRHYPLGTAFRTLDGDSRLTVAFGRECRVVVVGQAAFGTRKQGLDEKSRAISLMSGIVAVKLPRNLPEGMFSVVAPGFTVVNPAGDSVYRYENTGDGDRATIRCVTGTLAVEGRHFRILAMRAANEVAIQTSQDALFTGIYGRRGDYVCKLDQGLVKIRDVETGESHVEEKFLEWKVSPQTAVRIQRAVPALGENMAVTVMTFDASGALKNRCAFAEKRFEVNSGEIAPNNKGNQAELAKKAAEAASETAAVDTETADPGAAADGVSSDAPSSGDDLDF